MRLKPEIQRKGFQKQVHKALRNVGLKKRYSSLYPDKEREILVSVKPSKRIPILKMELVSISIERPICQRFSSCFCLHGNQSVVKGLSSDSQ